MELLWRGGVLAGERDCTAPRKTKGRRDSPAFSVDAYRALRNSLFFYWSAVWIFGLLDVASMTTPFVGEIT